MRGMLSSRAQSAAIRATGRIWNVVGGPWRRRTNPPPTLDHARFAELRRS
jgi:hypothetical protein